MVLVLPLHLLLQEKPAFIHPHYCLFHVCHHHTCKFFG